MRTRTLGADPRLVRRLFIAVALTASGAAPGASYDVAPDHYLSLGVLYTEPDSSRGADYGTGLAFAYGHRLMEGRWIELRAFNNILETGPQTSIDFYHSGAGLELLQALGDESRSHFYALGGGGFALNDVKPDDKDDTSGYVTAAGGWRIDAVENWGVRPRLELRYTYDTFDGGQSDLQLGLTFEIAPRSERVVEKKVEVQKIVEVPVEVEKIVEREVECAEGMVPMAMPAPTPPPAAPPSSPQAAPSAPASPAAPAAPSPAPPAPAATQPPPFVSPEPAPAAPPAAAPAAGPAGPAGPDSDGDGVPDDQDRCPDTSQGAAVGPNGCVLLD